MNGRWDNERASSGLDALAAHILKFPGPNNGGSDRLYWAARTARKEGHSLEEVLEVLLPATVARGTERSAGIRTIHSAYEAKSEAERLASLIPPREWKLVWRSRHPRLHPFKLIRRDNGKFNKIPMVHWKYGWRDPNHDWQLPKGAQWGLALPPGTIVLDVDNMDLFLTLGLDLPDTRAQRTPSGGAHLFYRLRPDRPVPSQSTDKDKTRGYDTRIGERGWVGVYGPAALSDPLTWALAPDWLQPDE
jgi:bifunctional DNA primase/polymerase-like protein